MKIISLMHENMSVSSEIQDCFERTSNNSIEQDWTIKFIKKLQSYSCIHSNCMEKEINNLFLNQKALQLSIRDFYNSFPDLVSRYSYLDKANILEDGYIYSQVELKYFNKNYLLKYKVNDVFDFLNIKNSKDSLDKKNELLNSGLVDYSLEVYELGNLINKILQSNITSKKNREQQQFLNYIEYVLELDSLLLANFIENNPAIKYYYNSQQIISQILTRCKKDSLITPITDESMNIYEILYTQKEVYKLNPEIKGLRFR